MRGILEPDHLIVMVLLVLVLFGGKKIPELAGGLGKGVREFRRGPRLTDVARLQPPGDPRHAGGRPVTLNFGTVYHSATVDFADTTSVTAPLTIPQPEYLAFEGIGVVCNLVLRK